MRSQPDDDGAKTAREHITNRHISQLPQHIGKKSVYDFGKLNKASLQTKQAIVGGLNAATFNLGTGAQQSNGRYIFTLDFDMYSAFMGGGQAIVGKLPNGRITGVNTLIVEADCQTVVTSFPSR